MYFSDEDGNLASLISKAEKLTENEILAMSTRATNRIKDSYSWDKIVHDYEELFL